MKNVDDINYIIGLSFFEGIGPIRFQLLKEYFGSVRNIYKADKETLLKVGLPADVVERFVVFKSQVQLSSLLEHAEKKGIHVIAEESDLFPESLKQIRGHPFILYALGRVTLLSEKHMVGIVGTRKPTIYGRQITKQFAESLASYFVIVSGMAMGVDAIAHQSALDTHGKTIAVLGCGVDICYPPVNISIYQRLKKEGLIISEFPPGMRSSRGVFPSRNRIIAALSDVVLITEGAEKSGSLITASFAAEYGKDVYAIPGPVTSPLSAATNSLIKKGAKIATDPSDILTDMNIVSLPKLKNLPELNDKQRKIVDLFSTNGQLHIDEIARSLNTDISSLSVELSVLTMKGILQEMERGEYTIKV